MLVGHVEHYSEKGLAGWAFDDERPDEPAYVDVFFDGTLFARLAACLPRVDGQQGGFRLILPPEMWRHRRRILVDVRFAATAAPLANTPRYLASRGAAKRILVMIPAGVRYNHDCIKARPAPLGEHITTYTNTGDWLVCDSSLKLLSFAEVEPVNVWAATDDDIARFNAEFDYAFLRGSNYIHPGFDWRDVEALLDRLKIPVIAFAVGAQAPRAGRLALPEASVRVWRSFADHAASIGVRGAYSAEVLNGIGIKNVEVIGCPSLFRRNDPWLQVRPKPLPEIRRVAFSLRREVSPAYACDVARYLRVQKAAILDLTRRFELTLTVHGEPAEKAFFYKDAALIARYRRQLLDAGWFESDDDPLIGLYERRLFYSQRVEDVDRFVAGQDLATGFRVHGNLPALAHGVPALFVDYDTRSRELADTFHIPRLTLDELADLAFTALCAPDRWDSFNRHYPDAYRRMAAFLDRNGLAHTMWHP